ncbi:MAG: L,D-transpeptidase family protein [Thermoanaerobaculia bacterium]|nr:L,D-transpeptidase family protein [Thermoanaerobaculia bacterium]
MLVSLLSWTACSPSVEATRAASDSSQARKPSDAGQKGTEQEERRAKKSERKADETKGKKKDEEEQPRTSEEAKDQGLAKHLKTISGPPWGMLDEDPHGAWDSVLTLYEKTGHQPLWFRDDALRARAAALVSELEAATDHGLDPRDYRTEELGAELQAAVEGDYPATDRWNLDVALTSAAVLYGAHLLRGRILPSEVEALWESREPKILLPARIASGIEEDSLPDTFDSLAPPHSGYDLLQKRLQRYRKIAESGGWPEVPGDGVVEPGDEIPSEVLDALVRRLRAEGFVGPATGPSGETGDGTRTYRGALADAVERFQKSRTLTVDGILGPKTRLALNRTASEIEQSIRTSLDRWRWMPHDLGSLAVIVNIPTYELFLYRNGQAAERMGVVVGKAGWPTRIIRDEIETVVFNPVWNVPRSIVEDEIVPKMQENPDYLAEEGLEVVRGWGDGEIVPRDEVSPEDLLDQERELRLRQPSGPKNALGRIKFLFPNKENIYLHDTPAGHLFGEADRSFSHGCVRVEQPVRLANVLLNDRNGWTRREVQAAIRRGENEHVSLDQTVPVYITYLTAVPAPETGLILGQDVYDLDDRHASLWNRGSDDPETGSDRRTAG